MDPQLKKEDRIIIELSAKEIFEGTIENISSNSIELYDICCPRTNTEISGVQVFYRNEIKSIKRIINQTESVENTSDTFRFDVEEYTKLKQMAYDHKFIDCAGTEFKNAVEKLKNRENIGVLGLGHSINRNKPFNLLVFTDRTQIYVFDMIHFNDLRGLKDILEDESIMKTVYDGALLFNTLSCRYQTNMCNIFDIKISESILEPGLENAHIGKSLTHHFNFPPSLLDAALSEMKSDILDTRPLTKSSKTQAALLATYLLTLKNHLTKKIFEKHITAVNETYSRVKSMTRSELFQIQIKSHREKNGTC